MILNDEQIWIRWEHENLLEEYEDEWNFIFDLYLKNFGSGSSYTKKEDSSEDIFSDATVLNELRRRLQSFFVTEFPKKHPIGLFDNTDFSSSSFFLPEKARQQIWVGPSPPRIVSILNKTSVWQV